MARSQRIKRRRRGLDSRAFAAVSAAICIALSGCAHRGARRPATATAQTPTYPPISPDSVQILNRRPPVAYDELGKVTVQEESAQPRARSMEEVREVAAQAGANAAVLLEERNFRQRNSVTRRSMDMRRVIALLIRRKDVATPPLENPYQVPAVPSPAPSPRSERGGPPPPAPQGAPPGATGT
jgi:hypothetical protein